MIKEAQSKSAKRKPASIKSNQSDEQKNENEVYVPGYGIINLNS